MEQLGHEQVLDLIRHGVHGIVGQIGGRFVSGRRGGGGLPAGNVDCVEVFIHLGEHGWLEAAVCG